MSCSFGQVLVSNISEQWHEHCVLLLFYVYFNCLLLLLVLLLSGARYVFLTTVPAGKQLVQGILGNSLGCSFPSGRTQPPNKTPRHAQVPGSLAGVAPWAFKGARQPRCSAGQGKTRLSKSSNDHCSWMLTQNLQRISPGSWPSLANIHE